MIARWAIAKKPSKKPLFNPIQSRLDDQLSLKAKSNEGSYPVSPAVASCNYRHPFWLEQHEARMSIARFTGLIGASISTLLSRCSQVPLTPLSTIITRSFKDRAVLQLRCKDCYYKKIDDRWWVLCPTHGRHKQRQFVDDVKKRWIVTHRTIGHRPFHKKEEAYICNQAPPGPYDYKFSRFQCPDLTHLPHKHYIHTRKSRLGKNQKLQVKIEGVEPPVSLY